MLERVSSSSSITGLYSALRVLWEPKPFSSIIPKLLVAREVLLSRKSSEHEQKMKTFYLTVVSFASFLPFKGEVRNSYQQM